jgi:tetratricopeptide (TPR) repeat protein
MKSYSYAFLIFFILLQAVSYGQPFDLIYPQGDDTDNLTKELKRLQEVQRDLALEKLVREPSKLDAYLELGELRMSQGRLQEAKRFFEMALEIAPKNLQANHGLVFVHYHLGEFNKAKEKLESIHKFHPLSSFEEDRLEAYKARLNTKGRAGLYIREDSRSFQEIGSILEGIFPSESFSKLELRYRFEDWSHKDKTEHINSSVYSITANYSMDSNNVISLNYAPEAIKSGGTYNGYSVQGLTGNENIKMNLRLSKNIFKDNIYTIKSKLLEESQSITLYGNLHPRAKLMQGITMSDISDGNSRRRYDTSIIYSIYRDFYPFINLSLSFWQASYDKQLKKDGTLLNYWAPSDYKGNELSASWERSFGVNWWFGIEGNYSLNSYKFGTNSYSEDNGPGYSIFSNYKFATGSIFSTFSERKRHYFTERRLESYLTLSF